jgi:hypothetical protein
MIMHLLYGDFFALYKFSNQSINMNYYYFNTGKKTYKVTKWAIITSVHFQYTIHLPKIFTQNWYNNDNPPIGTKKAAKYYPTHTSQVKSSQVTDKYKKGC